METDHLPIQSIISVLSFLVISVTGILIALLSWFGKRMQDKIDLWPSMFDSKFNTFRQEVEVSIRKDIAELSASITKLERRLAKVERFQTMLLPVKPESND